MRLEITGTRMPVISLSDSHLSNNSFPGIDGAPVLGRFRGIVACPPPVAHRYRAERLIAMGSALTTGLTWGGPRAGSSATAPQRATSTVWLGRDDETGEPIAVKAYNNIRDARDVYEAERRIHEEMRGCTRLAALLGCDDERMILVKTFARGDAAGQTHPNRVLRDGTWVTARNRYSRPRVRALLADILSVVSHAARIGRVADHALGGVANVPVVGAAESNAVISDAGAVVVDVCNAPRGQWRPTDLVNSTVMRALWLHRWTPSRLAPDSPLFHDAVEMPSVVRDRLHVLRLRALRQIDDELGHVIARARDPVSLHAALEKLA